MIPYDNNRVILLNKINSVDYVNASWIKNVTMTPNMPTFIAAQGPFSHTIPHFLEMVLENKVTAIVMLTKLKETVKDNNGKWLS